MVKEVVFFPTSEPLKDLIHRLKPPVKIHKDGDYLLEITLISHVAEAGHAQIIFQHNLVDAKTEDTIWELSRTYDLK